MWLNGTGLTGTNKLFPTLWRRLGDGEAINWLGEGEDGRIGLPPLPDKKKDGLLIVGVDGLGTMRRGDPGDK
jgi:hypothetical protein